MKRGPAALGHCVIKVREATPSSAAAPEADRVWAAVTVVPPSSAPSLAGSIWYYLDPARGEGRPALHMLPLRDGQPRAEELRHANLWFDPKLGMPAARDTRPGWRRLDFLVALPADRGRMLLRCPMETSPGQFAYQDLGVVEPAPSGWVWTPADPAPPPFLPPRAAAGEATILVGGAPKSGTTWMQMLLAAHPEVVGNGEGAFFGLLAVAPPRYTNNWFPPEIDLRQLTDLAHAATLRHVFALYRDWFGCRIVADKSPGNSAMARRLLRALPEARLIHCVRHPLDVLVSRLHHEAALLSGGLSAPELATHADAVAAIAPALRDGRVPSPRGPAWALVTAILDDWVAAQAEALAALEVWPERVRVTRYEDLLSDGPIEAARAFAFAGASADRTVVDGCLALTRFATLRGKAGDTGFFRAGVARQFQAAFARADQARMFDHLRAVLPTVDRFGYTMSGPDASRGAERAQPV